ncbi:MAG TPA: response regulator [Opitutaceae bacterium]
MSPTVLTIDDDAEITELIRFHLTNAGFEVLSASTIGEALAIMRTRHLDIILLDLILPDVHGYSLFELMRAGERRTEIPVVVVSGCRSRDAQRLAQQFGAREYVMKPFLPADLVGCVCRTLQGSV